MQHPLIDIIRQTVSLPDEEAFYVLSFFKEKQYKRNEVILHVGDHANTVFFVVKGALHQYYMDDNGNEHTCNFIFENEFITDLESFSKQIPATSFIKCLEPTTCFNIQCSELVELIESSPAVNEFFRLVVENVAAEGMRRARSLQSASPEKSFRELLEKRPDIFQRVPQRYIAQYLGVAPESLSRIKKRMYIQSKS